MTPLWLRLFNKEIDMTFTIPATSNYPFWPTNCHKLLIVGIILPYLSYRPWQFKGTPKMFAVGRQLSTLFCQKKLEGGDILRKFLQQCREFQAMPKHVVWKMLYLTQKPPFSRMLHRKGTRKRRSQPRGESQVASSLETKTKKRRRLPQS